MNMNKAIIVLMFSLGMTASAMAQEAGVDGPVATLASGDKSSMKGVVASAGTQAQPGASVAVDTAKRPPKLRSAAPPAEITVVPGKNTVFSVALFHANRIVTPFKNPEIRTSSTSLLTIENGIIYVTTQAEDPIGLFVFDKSDPAQAISLTLMPGAISPVSVKINLFGWAPPTTNYSKQGNSELARTFETEDPYVSTLKSLFKELASQKVPEGYGMSGVNGRYPFMPNCNMPGFHVAPMQILEGVAITAVVARITNISYSTLEVNESACSSDRMLGAATWPKSTLAPGESAELYIGIKTPTSDENRVDRPSVVTGRIR